MSPSRYRPAPRALLAIVARAASLIAALVCTTARAAPPTIDVFMAAPPTGVVGAGGGRDVGLRLESRWFDFEARTPTCIASVAVSDAVARCRPVEGGPSPSARRDRRALATFKVPQVDERLPYVDLTARRWSAAPDASGRAGGAAGILLTKYAAAFDGLVSYEVPMRAGGDDGRWQTLSGAFAWHPSVRWTVELSHDRSRDVGTGQRDRSSTLRLLRGGQRDGIRLVAWLRRDADDPLRPWRAGLGARMPL